MNKHLVLALLLTAAAPLSCTRGEPPGAQFETAATAPLPQPSGSARAKPAAPPASSSAPTPIASASDGGAAADDAGAVDWKNKLKPELATPGLEEHGKVLLEAIANDDPERAKDFFFPRAPFTPLKDVTNPDKYWVQLYASYKRDIHELHLKRRDWSGVSFESITLGTPPTWVKPGDEYNKIGYYRTFNAKLRYKIGERKGVLDVHTIISWQGEWYVTHLGAIKKN